MSFPFKKACVRYLGKIYSSLALIATLAQRAARLIAWFSERKMSVDLLMEKLICITVSVEKA